MDDKQRGHLLRIRIIYEEIDRYMSQHKISMEEVTQAYLEIKEDWVKKGCPSPDLETRDNYGQFFQKPSHKDN
jgi:hypothetical protein